MYLKYTEGEITYFDKARKYIEEIYYADKSLEECKNTLQEIIKESKNRRGSNEYLTFAERIMKYKNDSNICEEFVDDYWFYLYLKQFTKDKEEIEYTFPMKDKKDLIIKVKPLNPYVEIEGKYYIDPKWHVLVSKYIYIDAAFNHQEEKINQKILELTGWGKLARGKKLIHMV